MISPEIPIVRGRFLSTLVLHAAFFAAIALRLSDRDIATPVYFLMMGGLLVGMNAFEASRLGAFLKQRCPAEIEKLTPRTGFRYNSLRGLRFVFSGDAEDDPILKRIKRQQRWVWFHSLSMPPVMGVMVISAVSVSKHH